MKTYKVFLVDKDDGLNSTSARNTKWNIEYKKGEVSEPHDGSKIFVFKHRQDAKHWTDVLPFIIQGNRMYEIIREHDMEIWEVEAGGNVDKCYIVYDILGARMSGWPLADLTGRLRSFWEGLSVGSRNIHPDRSRDELIATPGTYMCDWVKPIKLVERVELTHEREGDFV